MLWLCNISCYTFKACVMDLYTCGALIDSLKPIHLYFRLCWDLWKTDQSSASQGSVKAHLSETFVNNVRLGGISFASMQIFLRVLLNIKAELRVRNHIQHITKKFPLNVNYVQVSEKGSCYLWSMASFYMAETKCYLSSVKFCFVR